ncbi:hypothetical protein K432DRAFT_341623 [Lepidopterella palustris CBS 459.81]|uniref:Ribosomal protein L28/L40, mitochondrial n=1 Tax=Lepidopterella palustris CBS 459.81 TaxID=1314670 RepID=A0A8E2EM09_9PEZI|nr:hypothetical protein K432DRAFT_341623 [Lepidopterella palustris CBS 459.81]
MRCPAIPFSFRPTFRPLSPRSRPTTCLHRKPFSPITAPFTSSARLLRKDKGEKKDHRITSIRYHLTHGLTPRPLRFSRLRALRHWTIHRAWLTFRAKQRAAAELELQRQYESMRSACEMLRLMDENGMAVEDGMAAQGKDVGRLYRIAMEKKGIWDSVPIEYARIQMDYPAKEAWNHGWTR